MDKIENQLGEIKEKYLRKMFDVLFGEREPQNVIIQASFSLDDVRDIIFKIKGDYNINQVIFYDLDYERIKNFFGRNPNEEEVDRFIPKYPPLVGKTKVIYIRNDATDYLREFNNKYSSQYHDGWKRINPEVYNAIFEGDKIDGINTATAVLPNIYWAKNLYGSEDKIVDLWKLMLEVTATREELKESFDELVEKSKELQSMNIHRLHFYTDLGTDFSILLTKYSLWLPTIKNIDEVYGGNIIETGVSTSPDCYSASGKVVLSQPRIDYTGLVTDTELTFEKGKIIDCKTDNEEFYRMVSYDKNRLNRIGEILIVPHNNSLSAQAQSFMETHLSTDCGIVLGDRYHDGINLAEDICGKNVPEEKVRRALLARHHNVSEWQLKYFFGDDSISIEAETGGRQKVIMEKGIWKI